ncbi:MAG: hypothetical protein M5U09_03650 [Gammaproteobacteria bacterium]|nr:hypothetical protein [Gammaproteobacteria bacterium]
MNYLIGDTYGRLLGQEVGYRTASLAAIDSMTPGAAPRAGDRGSERLPESGNLVSEPVRSCGVSVRMGSRPECLTRPFHGLRLG